MLIAHNYILETYNPPRPMSIWVIDRRRIFLAFFIFGLLNNVLYVVILSAAVDLVGPSTPKAVVLLSDIIPSLTVKVLSPFVMHLIPYRQRIWTLVALSSSGMAIVSLTNQDATVSKILGIVMASASSGLGEVSFLQLTHYYETTSALGGFSSGTGGAGLAGSFLFMLLTNVLGIQVWIALLLFAVAPLGFILAYYFMLPAPVLDQSYSAINDADMSEFGLDPVDQEEGFPTMTAYASRKELIIQHIKNTFGEIRPLIRPFMLPLCTVYVAEYVINQGISPTMLFPLKDLPKWLFTSYRDIYVVYGFLYQLGVFVSRSSINFGIRVSNLSILSVLQVLNVLITLCQSIFDLPFSNIWLVLMLIFYEGLLGGLSYVNTFMSVSEQAPPEKREFSMGCVGISDSFGVMLAGCINLWLETKLCELQVNRGRSWCRTG
ncbi:CLN3 family protein [Clavispora lusitaniae]|uniref:CLN3 family protein n=1 Tax=Clavispora lusitaniae TaxID=36911 RepID=UPI00202BE2C7|nr:CLN3 family protein [Clavispora lusitaniae]